MRLFRITPPLKQSNTTRTFYNLTDISNSETRYNPQSLIALTQKLNIITKFNRYQTFPNPENCSTYFKGDQIDVQFLECQLSCNRFKLKSNENKNINDMVMFLQNSNLTALISPTLSIDLKDSNLDHIQYTGACILWLALAADEKFATIYFRPGSCFQPTYYIMEQEYYRWDSSTNDQVVNRKKINFIALTSYIQLNHHFTFSRISLSNFMKFIFYFKLTIVFLKNIRQHEKQQQLMQQVNTIELL